MLSRAACLTCAPRTARRRRSITCVRMYDSRLNRRQGYAKFLPRLPLAFKRSSILSSWTSASLPIEVRFRFPFDNRDKNVEK